MKQKTIFSKIMIIIIVALVCLILTLLLAFLFGSVDVDIFDFSNLNFSNMIPVIIIGGLISCVIIGVLVVVLAKDVFSKVKDDFFKNNNDGRNEK